MIPCMRAVHVEPPAELGTRDGLAYALFLPDGDTAGGVVIVHGAFYNALDYSRVVRRMDESRHFQLVRPFRWEGRETRLYRLLGAERSDES